jgi:putative membrane protein
MAEPPEVDTPSTTTYMMAKERTMLASERNRLASERTFLAWVRTALASVGGGFALIRFFYFENPTHQFMIRLVGDVLILLGIGILIVSLFDFFESYKRLKPTKPGAGYYGAISITFILVIISVILLVVSIGA